ncbi:hypothetical protein PUNSTDRAFT_131895 [Punctularia strigosozonata HHB-11173 SS5]|uniref:uncharacterized protein n=1 Tax=Punctularia strigosozonata (strain HHB-11173) TaxID=741275 RepID=UPI0004416AA3|nr:uncharacterized protein PUNSTDRAFT_131895 [Punctularia strigosozonata HHB-11173 SS5]EIN11740.1 hypothetical protein PUNSTDRAFT_131895 [Punctularia strigosozonata HHB-11173 SS5]
MRRSEPRSHRQPPSAPAHSRKQKGKLRTKSVAPTESGNRHNISSTPEFEIIEEAKRIGEENPFVKGHIAEVYSHAELQDYGTGDLWKRLGAKRAQQRRKVQSERDQPETPKKRTTARVLRVLLMRRLDPITVLSGPRLRRAVWDITYCHFFLWIRGIHHRDISIGNMMYYETDKDIVKGVLNDYDLCSVYGCPSRNGERTGTTPFMALDLLTEDAWRGYVEHLYRHDAESVLWVIAYLIGSYTADGILMRHSPFFCNWRGDDYQACRKDKHEWIFSLQRWHACALPKGREPDRAWLIQVARFYRQKMNQRIDALYENGIPIPDNDRDEFMLFFRILPEEDRAGLLKELQLTDTERARIASTFDLPI